MTAYEQEMSLMAQQLTRWVEEANPPGDERIGFVTSEKKERDPKAWFDGANHRAG
jgi:hypothetical protein